MSEGGSGRGSIWGLEKGEDILLFSGRGGKDSKFNERGWVVRLRVGFEVFGRFLIVGVGLFFF